MWLFKVTFSRIACKKIRRLVIQEAFLKNEEVEDAKE